MVDIYPIEVYILCDRPISNELLDYNRLIELLSTPGIYNWEKSEISKQEYRDILSNKNNEAFYVKFINKYWLSVINSSVDEACYPNFITFEFLEDNQFLSVGEEIFNELKKLIIKTYFHFRPLFVRTGSMEHYGWPELIEKKNKLINSIHWMQIISKEVRDNLEIKDINKVDKLCYELEDLSDKGLFLRPMKSPFDSDDVIVELADLMNVDFPEYIKWW